MIYGLNFTRTPIPLGFAKKFAKSIREEGKRLYLAGVTDSFIQVQDMMALAANGHRTVAMRSRDCAAGKLWGVYTS